MAATTPTTERKAKPLPKVLTREEVRRFLGAIHVRYDTGMRNRVMCQVMYRCGLRVSEVCNLTHADVDLTNGFIYVRHGKGNKDRTVPLDDATIEWLRKWEERRQKLPSSPWYFCTLNGKQVSSRYVQQMFEIISKRSGVYLQDGAEKRPVHPHTLRHCFATECLEDGMSLIEVQRLLGHAYVSTTQRYLEVRPLDLREKIRNRPADGLRPE